MSKIDNTPIYITEEGKNEKLARLEFLRIVERPKIIEDIKIARGFGDLSENAEYDDARDRQLKCELEISKLESEIKRLVVVEVTDDDLVQMGKTITVKNKQTGDNFTFRLVSTDEANVDLGKISTQSPLGAAILGKREGKSVPVKATTGASWIYKIIEVKLKNPA